MDHAIPFPTGPSTTPNSGLLCEACHQLKTLRLLHITRTSPDGSATLRTAWGQHTQIGPRPYLDTGIGQLQTAPPPASWTRPPMPDIPPY